MYRGTHGSVEHNLKTTVVVCNVLSGLGRVTRGLPQAGTPLSYLPHQREEWPHLHGLSLAKQRGSSSRHSLNPPSYTRAFGDGPRNFEPWSRTWTTPELAPPPPNYHTTTGVTFQLLDRFNVHAALHGGSLVVLGSNS
ncbi:hypothetical protein TNCV_801441 [Trichonephila clavipes]|nr:hypothetical protein TNCV_801441 [Trichonephila clavipes]